MTASPLIPGNEEIVAAIVAKLQASLNDTIAVLNAAAGAAVQLDSVPNAQVLDYIPTPDALLAFPTIGVQDGEGVLEDDTGWSATGHHGWVVAIFYASPDQQTLARALRRYRRAVASVLIDGRRIGSSAGAAWGVTDIRFRPGPTLGRGEEPRQWMSYTQVGFVTLSEEYAT